MADILDSAQKNADGIVVSPPEPELTNTAPSTPVSALEVPVTPPPQQTPVVNPITGSSSIVTTPKVEPTPKPSKSQLTPNEPASSHESAKQDSLIVPPKNLPPPKNNNISYVSSKRKPKVGPVIAGLLLLLLTLPIAIYYVSQQNHQQQDIRSRAADVGAYPTQMDVSHCTSSTCACSGQSFKVCDTLLRDSHGSSCSDWCTNPNTNTTPNYTTLGSQCKQGTGDAGSCSTLKTACISGNSSACSNLCGTAQHSNETTCVPPQIGCAGAAAGDTYCTTWHWTSCTNAGTGQNGVGCDVNKPGGSGGEGGGSTSTPTPTPIPGSECTAIQVFQNSTLLDATGLAALQPGDAVVITVAGANASKAHIRINGGAWIESTTLNSNGAYTFNYTIPSSITNFTIESEVFGSDGNWH